MIFIELVINDDYIIELWLGLTNEFSCKWIEDNGNFGV